MIWRAKQSQLTVFSYSLFAKFPVPVPIMSMNMTVPMAVTTHRPSPPAVTPSATIPLGETEGCVIDGLFYEDGAQVPSDPEKPCDLCYCIRNHTACVMQECVLHVEGCSPVMQPGICCPVRYECDASNITSVSTTPLPSGSYGCTLDGQSYNDGDFVPSKNPCDYCYCMHGDIVCAVQDCAHPLEPFDGCQQVPNTDPNQCCPIYECVNLGAGEIGTAISVGSGVDTVNPPTEAPSGIQPDTVEPSSVEILETTTPIPEDSLSAVDGESQSVGSIAAVTESPIQSTDLGAEEIQPTEVVPEKNEETDITAPVTSHPEELEKPDETLSVHTPIEESSQFPESLVTEQPSRPEQPSQLNSAENELSEEAGQPQESGSEYPGPAVESVEGSESPEMSSETTEEGSLQTEVSKPDKEPVTEGTISSDIEEGKEPQQFTTETNTEAANQTGSEQQTEAPQPVSESNTQVTIDNGSVHELEQPAPESGSENINSNGSEQELEAQQPVSEPSTDATGSVSEEVPEEQQHGLESITETASSSGYEQDTEAQKPESSTEDAINTEISQGTEGQKPEQESITEVPVQGEFEEGPQELQPSTVSASEVHQPEAEVNIENALGNSEFDQEPQKPESQFSVTIKPEETGNNQPETTPVLLIGESTSDLDNVGQVTSTSATEPQESTGASESELAPSTDVPILKPDTSNQESESTIEGSSSGNQGQSESIESSQGGEMVEEVQTSTEHLPQESDQENASTVRPDTTTDASENSTTDLEIAPESPVANIESGSSVAESTTESNAVVSMKPDEGISTQSFASESFQATQVEGSGSAPTDESSESKPGESISTNDQETTIAPVGLSPAPETAASESEFENSAVEWSTQSPSNVPGEGSCLLNGITYADGDNIPPPSPCQISCKCEMSIVRCKVVECPETIGTNLANCRPIFMPNKCCPAFECDDSTTDSPHIIAPAPEIEVSIEGSGVQGIDSQTGFEINSSEAPATESNEPEIKPEEHLEWSGNEDSQNEERPVEITTSKPQPTDTGASASEGLSPEGGEQASQFEQTTEGFEGSQESLLVTESSVDQGAGSESEILSNVVGTPSETELSLSQSEQEGSGDEGPHSSELLVSTEGTNVEAEEVQTEVESSTSHGSTTETLVSVSQQEQTEGSGSEQSQPSEQTTAESGPPGGDSEGAIGTNISEGPETEIEVLTNTPEELTEGSGNESSQFSELEVPSEATGNQSGDSQTESTSETPLAEAGLSVSQPEVFVDGSGSEGIETPQHENSAEVSSVEGDSQSVTGSGVSQESSVESVEKPEHSAEGLGDEGSENLVTSTETTNAEGDDSQASIDVNESQSPSTETSPLVDHTEQPSQSLGEEGSQPPESDGSISGAGAVGGESQTAIDSSVSHESSTEISVPVAQPEQSTQGSIEEISQSSETEVLTETNDLHGADFQAGTQSSEGEGEINKPEGSGQESFSTNASLTVIESESSSPFPEIETGSQSSESTYTTAAESQTSQASENLSDSSTASPESGAAPEVQASIAPEDEQTYITVQESDGAMSSPSTQEPETSQDHEDESEPLMSSSSEAPNTLEADAQTASSPSSESHLDGSSVLPDSSPATVNEGAAVPSVTGSEVETGSEHQLEDHQPVAPSSESSAMPQPGIEEESELDGISPSACLFDGKVYVSAQQIPREDHCDFCFCFRGDIICLQQSCPPPIPGCVEETISGFCCPRYECPVRQVSHNVSWHDPVKQVQAVLAGIPQGFDAALVAAQDDQVTVEGCEIKGEFYQFGELVGPASGPCLECR